MDLAKNKFVLTSIDENNYVIQYTCYLKLDYLAKINYDITDEYPKLSKEEICDNYQSDCEKQTILYHLL